MIGIQMFKYKLSNSNDTALLQSSGDSNSNNEFTIAIAIKITIMLKIIFNNTNDNVDSNARLGINTWTTKMFRLVTWLCDNIDSDNDDHNGANDIS